MSSIEQLRARVLANAPTHDYMLCLDPVLRASIEAAQAALDAAAPADGQPASNRRRIADKPTDPGTAQTALDAARQAAVDADALLVLRWRRAAPDEYQQINDDAMAAHTAPDGKVDTGRFLAGLQDLLRTRTFVDAFTPDGEPLALSWAEVSRNALSMGDVEQITRELIDFNKNAAAVPFTRASFGRSAQS